MSSILASHVIICCTLCGVYSICTCIKISMCSYFRVQNRIAVNVHVLETPRKIAIHFPFCEMTSNNDINQKTFEYKGKKYHTAAYGRNSTKTRYPLFLEKQKKHKHKNFLHKMLIHANALFPSVEHFAWIKHDMWKILHKIFSKTRYPLFLLNYGHTLPCTQTTFIIFTISKTQWHQFLFFLFLMFFSLFFLLEPEKHDPCNRSAKQNVVAWYFNAWHVTWYRLG